jgi:uncharacterized protein YggE
VPPVRLSVAGSASQQVVPERATPRIQLTAEGADRAAVLKQVTALHQELVSQAQDQVASGAATRWSSNDVWVRAEDRYRPDGAEPMRVHVASAELRVRFKDFAALGPWLAEIGARVGVQVQGVQWSLTDPTRESIARELRLAAVRDAQQRARDYADALGLSDVALEQLWEADLRPGSGSSDAGLSRKAFAYASADAVQPIELGPEPLEVAHSVTVDFVAS